MSNDLKQGEDKKVDSSTPESGAKDAAKAAEAAINPSAPGETGTTVKDAESRG